MRVGIIRVEHYTNWALCELSIIRIEHYANWHYANWLYANRDASRKVVKIGIYEEHFSSFEVENSTQFLNCTFYYNVHVSTGYKIISIVVMWSVRMRFRILRVLIFVIALFTFTVLKRTVSKIIAKIFSATLQVTGIRVMKKDLHTHAFTSTDFCTT